MNEWIRVTKANPCPICEKPDWCCYTSTGAILCMRVQSEKPSKGNAGGWLHLLGDTKRIFIPIKPKPKVEIDCGGLFEKWKQNTDPKQLVEFAESLGVDPMSLHLIGCAWSEENFAWAIPMRNEHAKIIGIRLRNEKGQKWAVTGSRSGLFIPPVTQCRNLLICEGPSDTAAALTLGFAAIGRPSCLGNETMINSFIKRNQIKEVVLIADNDEAGMNGSKKLQSSLKVPSVIVSPPCKDLREFVQIGATREVIEGLFKSRLFLSPR